MRRPTAADFRRLAARRDRWQLVGTVLCVVAVAALVFWLLPLPTQAR